MEQLPNWNCCNDNGSIVVAVCSANNPAQFLDDNADGDRNAAHVDADAAVIWSGVASALQSLLILLLDLVLEKLVAVSTKQRPHRLASKTIDAYHPRISMVLSSMLQCRSPSVRVARRRPLPRHRKITIAWYWANAEAENEAACVTNLMQWCDCNHY